jgi:voltage-gated potassium channel Kch
MSRRDDPSSGLGGVRHRLRYHFDNLLARGTWPVVVWLGAITLGVVFVAALLLTIFGVTLSGSEDGSWLEDFWQSLMRALDTGTMAGDVGWGRRVLALTITIFGVLVAGTLIGVIASGVEQRVDRMRRGRSVVVESEHLVVLGASDRIPVLAQQFVLANESRANSAIVFLADCDPTELADAVGRAVDDRRGSRLVFRSGDPTSPSDLEIVRLGRARAVIVLADDGGEDARAVKTVFAVGAVLGGFDSVPIVVELHDQSTADSLAEACGESVHTIIAAQAAARVAAFALRQRGLSQVVGELFDYRGADIHVRRQADLVGLPFSAVLGRYAKARPIGIGRADGRIELNPPPEARFEDDDRLVLVADDAEHLHLAGEPLTVPATRDGDVAFDFGAGRERLLVSGWNRLGRQLLSYWSTFTPDSSTVEVVYDPGLIGADEVDVPPMGVARVEVTPAAKLSAVMQTDDEERRPTTVILLAYADHLSVTDADSRTLLDLMVLRRRLTEHGDFDPRVVVELLDVDNVELARLPGADDYLVSQATGSQFIAQLAEQPDRRLVYVHLYAADGPSIHLVPAGRFGLTGETSTPRVVEAVYRAGAIALGWRRASARGGELTLNPHESARVLLEADDEIVVIG